MPLPKKYRKQYRVELKREEKVVFLALRLVGILVFFLTSALAVDIYNLLH